MNAAKAALRTTIFVLFIIIISPSVVLIGFGVQTVAALFFRSVESNPEGVGMLRGKWRAATKYGVPERKKI
jgi:hypothetical protein